MISKGDKVRIKREWMDTDFDGKVVWEAIDNEEKGRVTIGISASSVLARVSNTRRFVTWNREIRNSPFDHGD